MTQPARPHYTATYPGYAPVTSKRKGQGARLIAEQHFGARPRLHDMTTQDGLTIEYVFACGDARLTVRETAA
ncbi:hypothetical protein [Deinococcus wulumuqiensis]|uniref:Uncharacterized protein n=4 Tax=Deinococcus wulumuqiensis TaxID=980427 RepID=A0ABQ2PWP8_9DEIO|nr:hypothetical protein [Deinococcus wulumuqiensis]QII20083.1 hypothetical protein G6R31_04360 [Deinococcus wulumuqiensis R12]GGP30019.1 hypothetical protein GCM10008021_16700 [Deinococcus wulumuqiensis]